MTTANMTNMEYRNWIQQHIDIGNEILYLSFNDCVATGLTLPEIISATEQAMIDYSLKKAEMPAKIGIHPQPDSLMHAMPAYLPEQFACGIKWGANFPTNNQRFPEVTPTNAVVLYNDPESGLLLSVMDALWITETRTPGVSMVALKHMGDPDATTFGMFGCGREGRAHVGMIEHAMPKLEKIYVYDLFEAAADRLIKELQPQVKAEIIKVKTPEELVKSAQNIVSAIPIAHTPAPVVKPEWVSKGQTLVTCDCHSVYEDPVYKNADIYTVDSIEQHELLIDYGYYPYGLPEIYAETGAVAAGVKPGRTNKDQIIVSNNVGMAVEDMMCARRIFDLALEKGIGIKLPLWDRTTK